jgi:hypothetical protein
MLSSIDSRTATELSASDSYVFALCIVSSNVKLVLQGCTDSLAKVKKDEVLRLLLLVCSESKQRYYSI